MPSHELDNSITSEDDEGESEEFSAGDEEYDELDYLDNDNDDIGYSVLTDADQFLNDKSTKVEQSGPTRASRSTTRTEDKTRTTFICLNQEAFRNQLKKEEQKSGNIQIPEKSDGPTRATRRGGKDGARTTFIVVNQDSFSKDLKSAAKEENEKPSVPTRPPRPERPARPPRSLGSQKSTENVKEQMEQQPQTPSLPFGKAPPPNRKNSLRMAESKPVIPPAFKELIQTEKDYINNLEVIQNVFLEGIRKQKILDNLEIVQIFANVEDLIPINKKLLEDLLLLEGSNFVSTKSVGEVFQYHARNFKAYGDYCSNQPNVHELIIEYKEQNQEFADFLKKCFRNPACKKQDIESFLVMPLQRLCRYPLLLKELVSYEHFTLKKKGPAGSSEHGICVWGSGSEKYKIIDLAQHWSGIACGGLHFAAVSLGNSIYVWGKGKEGQLGLGDTVPFRDEPTLLPLYSDSNQPLKAKSVTCGPLQTAIITDENQLYLCGALPSGLVFVPTLQLFQKKSRTIRSVSLGVHCMFFIVETEEVSCFVRKNN